MEPPNWYRPSDWTYLGRRRSKIVCGALLLPLLVGAVYFLTLVLWGHLRPSLWIRYELRTSADGTVSWHVDERTDTAASRIFWRTADGTERPLATSGGWGRADYEWGYSTSSSVGATGPFSQPVPIAAEGRWLPLDPGEERELCELTWKDQGVTRLVVRCEKAEADATWEVVPPSQPVDE